LRFLKNIGDTTSRRWWWWLLASPPLLLRVALCLKPEWFWYDESFSVLVARLPWAGLWEATVHDVHPPLYYAVLKVWLAITGRVVPWVALEVQARSLSLLLSLLALWLYGRVLDRIGYPKRFPMLLALYTSGLIYFAAEARMYALMEVLILGAILALWRPEPQLTLAAVLIAALCWTHNAGLYYAVSIAAATWLRDRSWLTAWGMVIVGAGAFVLWLPWVPAMLTQVSSTQEAYWIGTPTIMNAAYVIFRIIFYARLHPAVWPLVVLLSGGLTIWGSILALRERAYVLPLAYGPVVLGFLSSAILGTGAIIPRILAPGLFFAVIVWAELLRREDVGRVLRPVVAVALVVGFAPFVYPFGKGAANYEFLAAMTQARDGDITYAGSTGALPMEIYSPVPFYIAPLSNQIGEGLTQETQAALGLRRTWLEELEDWERCWLIDNETILTSDEEINYMRSLIARYDGELVATMVDGASMEGKLWLLTRD